MIKTLLQNILETLRLTDILYILDKIVTIICQKIFTILLLIINFKTKTTVVKPSTFQCLLGMKKEK